MWCLTFVVVGCCYSLFVVRCSLLFVIRWLLAGAFVVYWLLSVAKSSLLGVCCLLLDA